MYALDEVACMVIFDLVQVTHVLGSSHINDLDEGMFVHPDPSQSTNGWRFMLVMFALVSSRSLLAWLGWRVAQGKRAHASTGHFNV
jgi:hypothetical protein